MLHQREAVIAWAIIFNYDLALLYSFLLIAGISGGFPFPVLLA